jgi:hypothetical protein
MKLNLVLKIPKVLKDIIGSTGMAIHAVSILDKNGNYTFIRWSAYYPDKKVKP